MLRCVTGWQAAEPMLAGLTFYFVLLQHGLSAPWMLATAILTPWEFTLETTARSPALPDICELLLLLVGPATVAKGALGAMP